MNIQFKVTMRNLNLPIVIFFYRIQQNSNSKPFVTDCKQSWTKAKIRAIWSVDSKIDRQDKNKELILNRSSRNTTRFITSS